MSQYQKLLHAYRIELSNYLMIYCGARGAYLCLVDQESRLLEKGSLLRTGRLFLFL